MYKFFGKPLKEVLSKVTKKVVFRFDTKGEFITDDPKIIERAMGYFDYIPMKAEPIGERFKKGTPIKEENNVKGEEIKKAYQCKQCDFETDNKGELLAHYREHKKGE